MGKKQSKGQGKRQKTGRFRAVWLVLRGQALTPQQMMSEWAEIQTTASEMFNRFNSLAARLVRAEKNMMKLRTAEIDALEQPDQPATGGRKAELRSRVAALRFPGAHVRREVPDEPTDQVGEVSG